MLRQQTSVVGLTLCELVITDAKTRSVSLVLKDGTAGERRLAAEVLGQYRPPAAAAVPLLRELARDRDHWVRDVAKKALKSIGQQ
jgi:hypothetical protein